MLTFHGSPPQLALTLLVAVLLLAAAFAAGWAAARERADREADARVDRLLARISVDARNESPALEEGRRLASEREDLIAAGVNPAELLLPLAPLVPARRTEHVLEIRMAPWSARPASNQVELVVHCEAPPGADCRLACEEGTCDFWVIQQDEQGPFHTAYDEDDDGEEVEVRHPLKDQSAEYCGSAANVSPEPHLTFGGKAPTVLARVPIDIRWESEDEVYWEPRQGAGQP